MWKIELCDAKNTDGESGGVSWRNCRVSTIGVLQPVMSSDIAHTSVHKIDHLHWVAQLRFNGLLIAQLHVRQLAFRICHSNTANYDCRFRCLAMYCTLPGRLTIWFGDRGKNRRIKMFALCWELQIEIRRNYQQLKNNTPRQKRKHGKG